MIQRETFLRVADNSGAKMVKCLQIKKSSRSSLGVVGDLLIVSVKSLQKKSKFSSKIKRGDIFYGILIRSQAKIFKSDCQWVHFFDNAIVLISKNLKPIGSRIIGPVLKILRQVKSIKLISLSSGLV